MGKEGNFDGVNAKKIKVKDERVAKITELIMTGLNGVQIYKYVTEKLNWAVTQRAVWLYVNKANEGFADQAKAKAKDEFGKGLARLNMLFAASLKIQDYKACLAIQKEINLMMGFTNRSTLEHIGNVSTSGSVTQKVQIEFISTGKRIATSEDQIDLKRIELKNEPDEAVIIEDNENDEPGETGVTNATTEPIPSGGTGTAHSDIQSIAVVQENNGVQIENDNTPGWHVFG